MIAFLQESSMYSMKKTLGECTAKVHLFVGERENKRILFSAKKIREVIKHYKITLIFWFSTKLRLNSTFKKELFSTLMEAASHQELFQTNSCNDFCNKKFDRQNKI